MSRNRHLLRVDFGLIVMTLLATLVAVIPASWSAPAVIYVSPSGSDWSRGVSPQSPRRSVQRAVDQARPGSVISLLPGVYRERVHVRKDGRPGQRVVIRAEVPGTAIITAAAVRLLTVNQDWQYEGDRIYSTPITHPVYALRHEHTWAFGVPWGGHAQLRELARRPHTFLAFCCDNDRLAIHFPANIDPLTAKLEIHEPAPAPREWGELKSANLWIEASHVELHGLRCEFGLGAGVMLWDAEDVVIADCAFSGATHGIDGRRGLGSCRGVTVERCWYDHFPQHDWHEQWLTHEETYAAYATSSLALLTVADALVQDNLVTHAGDGLQVTAPERIDEGDLTVVRGNWICWATDDAVECDGPGGGVLVEENLIYECHEAFSFCPLTAGPVRVERNLSLHESGGINGASFKFIEVETPARPIRNISASDNLIVGHWGCWHSVWDLSDVSLTENLFVLQRLDRTQWPEQLKMSGNEIVARGAPASHTRGPRGLLDDLEAALPVPSAKWSTNHPARAALDRRPGPKWLDWDTHPALRELSRRLATETKSW